MAHLLVNLRLLQTVSLLGESLTWHLAMPHEELLPVGLSDEQEWATKPGHTSCIWQVGSKETGNCNNPVQHRESEEFHSVDC